MQDSDYSDILEKISTDNLSQIYEEYLNLCNQCHVELQRRKVQDLNEFVKGMIVNTEEN